MSVVHCGGSATTKINNLTQDGIQPNAVDIRLGKVFRIKNNVFEINANNDKVHRGVVELSPDNDGYWFLSPGSYEFTAIETVSVGEDEAGILIGRSTLNRNDVLIRSCLYDSGYQGAIVGVITIGTGPIKIEKGTRIAQYLSFKAETLHKYHGSYGFGTEDDAKYGVTK